MAKYLNFTLVLTYCLLLALYSQANIIAQLPIANMKTDTSSISASFPPHSFNNATITIHSINSIQGNNFNVIKQEEPVIKKEILNNIVNAIYLAKGSVKSSIPVNVNAKIINQLDNTRIDTTQGIDMTKKLIATELASAINTTATNSNGASHIAQQSTKIVVDNQAVCGGIDSPTKATCIFSVNIHG